MLSQHRGSSLLVAILAAFFMLCILESSLVLGKNEEKSEELETAIQRLWDGSEVDFDSEGNAIVTTPEEEAGSKGESEDR